MAQHPLLVKAAQHLAAARAIQDEYEGKAMPAEAAHQMDQHLSAFSELKTRVTREAKIEDASSWIEEPDYKHDMSNGATVAASFGHGAPLLDEEKAERHTKAFWSYVRHGDAGLSPQMKADLVENATGQNLIPTDFAGTILKELPREAVIRSLAFVRPTTKNTVDVGNLTIAAAGWGKLETGTTAADGLPATPAAKDTITVHDLNALVKLGRDELEDSDENLAEIIRAVLTMKFGEQEDDAFAFGTGTGQPWGIGKRAETGVITQGVTAAAAGVVVADDLKKLKYAVPAQFRKKARAVYLGHTSVEQAVALLKDVEGRYLLQPSAREGEPDTLFGHRWYTVDGLPDLSQAGADDASAMFGDVFAGYMVADRRQMTVQRLDELYAAEGKIGLLFTHRVGGDVIRPKAFAKYLV